MAIYLDNASATQIDDEVLGVMLPFLKEEYGNSSSDNSLGKAAKKAINDSRKKIAMVINSDPDEIIFTPSATASINLALLGIAESYKRKGKHILTAKIEHKAVLETANHLADKGYEIEYIDTDKYGLIDIVDLKKKIRKDTILISVMYANNEIGTIQDVKSIGKIARENDVFFHTDACQAAGYLDLDVQDNNIDLMTINSAKIYGPKGCALLYAKQGIKLAPLIFGGGQENGLISGTQNVPAIVGFAKALELSDKSKKNESERLTDLRDKIIEQALIKISDCILNGHRSKRLPNNVNLSIKGVDSETLLEKLEEKGFIASSGSACTTGSLEPSHVIIGLGIPMDYAHGTIRITLGKFNKEEDITSFIDALIQTVNELR